MGCKHRWKILSDVILKSGYEDGFLNGQIGKVKGDVRPVLQKVHSLTIVCEFCGRVRHYREASFTNE
jgi:hypothetical protein